MEKKRWIVLAAILTVLVLAVIILVVILNQKDTGQEEGNMTYQGENREPGAEPGILEEVGQQVPDETKEARKETAGQDKQEDSRTEEEETDRTSGNMSDGQLSVGGVPSSDGDMEEPAKSLAGSGTVSMVALADTKEEAERIADLYGITLVSFDYGVAVYETTKDPQELIELGEKNQYPAIGINNTFTIQ